jgi:hypothetical protein
MSGTTQPICASSSPAMVLLILLMFLLLVMMAKVKPDRVSGQGAFAAKWGWFGTTARFPVSLLFSCSNATHQVESTKGA